MQQEIWGWREREGLQGRVGGGGTWEGGVAGWNFENENGKKKILKWIRMKNETNLVLLKSPGGTLGPV
jgi:hypothetical protein